MNNMIALYPPFLAPSRNRDCLSSALFSVMTGFPSGTPSSGNVMLWNSVLIHNLMIFLIVFIDTLINLTEFCFCHGIYYKTGALGHTWIAPKAALRKNLWFRRLRCQPIILITSTQVLNSVICEPTKIESLNKFSH